MKNIRRKLLGILLVIFLALLGIAGVFVYRGHLYYRELLNERPVAEAVGEYTSNESYVPFEAIDEDFVHAVTAVEDRRFFERQGTDYIAFLRAVFNNLRSGRLLEGGSTIEAQIAKNLYLGSYVTSLNDKIAEIFLARDLENSFTKKELFALYANMNYYGDSYWGIRKASEGYYRKDPGDLSLAQASVLAGIPNAPARYQLSTGYGLAKQRQVWVLKKMLQNGYISTLELYDTLSKHVQHEP